MEERNLPIRSCRKCGKIFSGNNSEIWIEFISDDFECGQCWDKVQTKLREVYDWALKRVEQEVAKKEAKKKKKDEKESMKWM